MDIQEGTKDNCMCFESDKRRHHEMESKGKMLQFHTTRSSVLIPIFISVLVYVVELYSVYYVAEESVSCLKLFRLFNTTFIPTHIATTTVFLYQHFSLFNYCIYVGKRRPIEDTELRTEYAGLTIGSTIVLAVFYVLFSFKVSLGNQIVLLVMQCLYMYLLWKYSIRDKIVIYEKPVKNVISY